MAAEANIASALFEQARIRPDATALIVPRRRGRAGWTDSRYSYRELADLSGRLAAGLAASGIGKGTRVAFMVPPSLEFFVLFFALLRAGCVPVLIDPGIGLRSLKHCLGEARPEVFIGVTRAQLARLALGWAKDAIRKTITVGPRLGWGDLRYADLLAAGEGREPVPAVGPDDQAAILFTSGSTGIPKGVVYRHRHFAAQVALVREAYGIEPGEVDLPTFPPFALFDPALGMTTVLPPMDYTRPAGVDPAMLVGLIERYRVTSLFGSPALMNTLSRHLAENRIRLPGLKRALSAGAPVPPGVIERMHEALDPDADIHTPYGATECLPVSTISGRELVAGLSDGHRAGKGVCVGRPLRANRVRVIANDDGPLDRVDEARDATPGEVGEICVLGPTTTDAYWARPDQTRLAKMYDADGHAWHRMGDLGWQDQDGRIWYVGRKSERVETESGTLYTEQVEGLFNNHPGVVRTALVGIGGRGTQRAVLVVEPERGANRRELSSQLLIRAASNTRTAVIRDILFRRRFPVDIRHNAKIRRGELAEWAAGKLGGSR